jgi:hypothetical protein
MERHLAVGNFDKAKLVYMKGGNESPYAVLSLETPLQQELPANTKIIGMNNQGEHVDGTIIAKTRASVTNLYVHYNDDDDCQVSGIHQESPKSDGCFQPAGGLVIQGFAALNYHYLPSQDNQYYSTLYGFSEHEAEKMFHCKEHCPYLEYEKFYHYYGKMDYGTLWIEHALAGTDTRSDQPFVNGNQDFSLLNDKGRAQAVATATVSLNVFTQINRIMTEWSIEVCETECGKGNSHDHPVPCPKAANNWDLAVATFVGSMEAENSGNGHLLYSMANARCQDFGTCDTSDNNQISKANRKIMDLFGSGRTLLEAGNCMDAAAVKFHIVELMTIPLIQGVLKSAYLLKDATNKANNDEERGRASAYAAAILPDLHACNQYDASVVENNFMFSTDSAVDFKMVRDALERNYNCLQVRCDDIGGLVDSSGTSYRAGAEPCNQRRMNSLPEHNPKDTTTTTTWWSSVGRAFLLCNVAVVGALLVVNRSKWVPAISSNADMIASSLLRRQRRQSPMADSDLQFYELQPSTASTAVYHQIQEPAGEEVL